MMSGRRKDNLKTAFRSRKKRKSNPFFQKGEQGVNQSQKTTGTFSPSASPSPSSPHSTANTSSLNFTLSVSEPKLDPTHTTPDVKVQSRPLIPLDEAIQASKQRVVSDFHDTVDIEPVPVMVMVDADVVADTDASPSVVPGTQNTVNVTSDTNAHAYPSGQDAVAVVIDNRVVSPSQFVLAVDEDDDDGYDDHWTEKWSVVVDDDPYKEDRLLGGGINDPCARIPRPGQSTLFDHGFHHTSTPYRPSMAGMGQISASRGMEISRSTDIGFIQPPKDKEREKRKPKPRLAQRMHIHNPTSPERMREAERLLDERQQQQMDNLNNAASSEMVRKVLKIRPNGGQSVFDLNSEELTADNKRNQNAIKMLEERHKEEKTDLKKLGENSAIWAILYPPTAGVGDALSPSQSQPTMRTQPSIDAGASTASELKEYSCELDLEFIKERIDITSDRVLAHIDAKEEKLRLNPRPRARDPLKAEPLALGGESVSVGPIAATTTAAATETFSSPTTLLMKPDPLTVAIEPSERLGEGEGEWGVDENGDVNMAVDDEEQDVKVNMSMSVKAEQHTHTHTHNYTHIDREYDMITRPSDTHTTIGMSAELDLNAATTTTSPSPAPLPYTTPRREFLSTEDDLSEEVLIEYMGYFLTAKELDYIKRSNFAPHQKGDEVEWTLNDSSGLVDTCDLGNESLSVVTSCPAVFNPNDTRKINMTFQALRSILEHNPSHQGMPKRRLVQKTQREYARQTAATVRAEELRCRSGEGEGEDAADAIMDTKYLLRQAAPRAQRDILADAMNPEKSLVNEGYYPPIHLRNPYPYTEEGFVEACEAVNVWLKHHMPNEHTLPSLHQMGADYEQGTENGATEWYTSTHQLIMLLCDKDIDDTTLFLSLLATSSRNSAIKQNTNHALLNFRSLSQGSRPAHGSYANDDLLNFMSGALGRCSGDKIRSFLSNLISPEYSQAVTVDTHMQKILLGGKGGLSLTSLEYSVCEEFFRCAAGYHGAQPHKFQAALWWKRMKDEREKSRSGEKEKEKEGESDEVQMYSYPMELMKTDTERLQRQSFALYPDDDCMKELETYMNDTDMCGQSGVEWCETVRNAVDSIRHYVDEGREGEGEGEGEESSRSERLTSVTTIYASLLRMKLRDVGYLTLPQYTISDEGEGEGEDEGSVLNGLRSAPQVVLTVVVPLRECTTQLCKSRIGLRKSYADKHDRALNAEEEAEKTRLNMQIERIERLRVSSVVMAEDAVWWRRDMALFRRWLLHKRVPIVLDKDGHTGEEVLEGEGEDSLINRWNKRVFEWAERDIYFLTHRSFRGSTTVLAELLPRAEAGQIYLDLKSELDLD